MFSGPLEKNSNPSLHNPWQNIGYKITNTTWRWCSCDKCQDGSQDIDLVMLISAHPSHFSTYPILQNIDIPGLVVLDQDTALINYESKNPGYK